MYFDTPQIHLHFQEFQSIQFGTILDFDVS
jgi:hypothetical protein